MGFDCDCSDFYFCADSVVGCFFFYKNSQYWGGGFWRFDCDFNFVNGAEHDLLDVLKIHNFNSIRLRIWNDPIDGYSNKEKTLALAKSYETSNGLLTIKNNERVIINEGFINEVVSNQKIFFHTLMKELSRKRNGT